MSIKSPKTSKEKPLQNKYSIPVQQTDLSIHDDNYTNLKQRFATEMRRMDREMTKFSKELMRLYEQAPTVQTVSSSAKEFFSNWERIMKSPLVQGEGETKMLMLQFDVSQFEPSEVKVKIEDDYLIVSASHRKKSEGSAVSREYRREIRLPKGIDPKSVICSVSRDGILMVQTPLPRVSIPDSLS